MLPYRECRTHALHQSGPSGLFGNYPETGGPTGLPPCPQPGNRSAMSHEKRLKELGIVLPEVPQPMANYVPGVIHNNTLYLSGQGPLVAPGEYATGIVGKDVTADEGYRHARLTGLALLSMARSVLGSLDRVERVVNVLGMVNAAPGFMEHPRVMNGFSDLMVEVFGDAGRHARAAVGMGTLPMNISIEITVIFAVRS